MPRVMYDSVTSRDIPPGARLVAGYVDGLYAWSAADWALHPYAVQVRITAVVADPAAQVADIESGALSPTQGAAWLKAKYARGEHPTLYFSVGRLAEVENALAAAGLDPSHGWSWWAALWDGVYAPYSSAVAKQYANPALSGGHYDLSWVADFWPGVDPLPAPPPPVVVLPPSPPSPSPAPADVSSAQLNFWSFAAEVLGRGLPRLLAAVIAEINHLRGL